MKIMSNLEAREYQVDDLYLIIELLDDSNRSRSCEENFEERQLKYLVQITPKGVLHSNFGSLQTDIFYLKGHEQLL